MKQREVNSSFKTGASDVTKQVTRTLSETITLRLHPKLQRDDTNVRHKAFKGRKQKQGTMCHHHEGCGWGLSALIRTFAEDAPSFKQTWERRET